MISSDNTLKALNVLLSWSTHPNGGAPVVSDLVQRFTVALDSNLPGSIPLFRILTDKKTGRQYLMAGFVSPTICEINPKPLSEKEEK